MSVVNKSNQKSKGMRVRLYPTVQQLADIILAQMFYFCKGMKVVRVHSSPAEHLACFAQNRHETCNKVVIPVKHKNMQHRIGSRHRLYIRSL